MKRVNLESFLILIFKKPSELVGSLCRNVCFNLSLEIHFQVWQGLWTYGQEAAGARHFERLRYWKREGL
jgi:hypothetical protein